LRTLVGVRPHITLFVGVLAISFAAIFIRLADAPPLVIATYRLTIASIILIPFAPRKSVKSLITLSRRDMLFILLSSAFIALHFWLWITSLSYTTIASSVMLVTSHPVFIALVSYFVWGERLNKLAISGIVIALIGVILINYGGFIFSSRAFWGDLLALMASFAMGAYLIIGGWMRERIDILPYLTIIYTCSAVILLAATMISGYKLFGYSPITYAMLVLLALVPQVIGHSSLNIAVRLLPVTFVSVAILGEPVGATILGYLLLKEIPTANEIAGSLLILCGIFMVLGRNHKYWMMK
jgi:drug/metabolite transporter (DMT)-like permease